LPKMADPIAIRRATAADADDVSRIIIRTLRETNAKDYPPHVIDAVATAFSPERAALHISTRQVYLATDHGRIVGTASLDGATIRSVFVDPDHQRKGIGASLMMLIESLARAQATDTLAIQSSLTAQAFYRKLGVATIHEELQGDERIIVMTKRLSSGG